MTRIVLIALLLMIHVPAAQALRCGNRLVVEGDRATRIVQRCGEPDLIDSGPVYVTPAGTLHSAGEHWYYNFGPSRLVVVLQIRGGRLVSERRGGYGYSGDPPGRCLPTGLLRRKNKFDLLWHCGAPDQRQAYSALRPLRSRRKTGGFEPVLFEEWVYEFGERFQARRVRLENGIVTNIETL